MAVFVENLQWHKDLLKQEILSEMAVKECYFCSIEEIKEDLSFIFDKPDNPKPEDKPKSIEEYSTISAGVTNSTKDLLHVTLTREDFAHKFQQFKSGTHCSQEVVISFGQQLSDLQRYDTLKLCTVNRDLLIKLFCKGVYIMMTKKALKKSVLNYFQNDEISKKRGLSVCDNVVRGLALTEKDHDLHTGKDKSDKKLSNIFSNYQRKDRSAGDQLTREFMEKYKLYDGVSSSYSELETRTPYSFDIYNKTGYLKYASDEIKSHNVVFYENKYHVYLVKEKYLDAFGKVYKTNKRSATVKLENGPKKFRAPKPRM